MWPGGTVKRTEAVQDLCGPRLRRGRAHLLKALIDGVQPFTGDRRLVVVQLWLLLRFPACVTIWRLTSEMRSDAFASLVRNNDRSTRLFYDSAGTHVSSDLYIVESLMMVQKQAPVVIFVCVRGIVVVRAALIGRHRCPIPARPSPAAALGICGLRRSC